MYSTRLSCTVKVLTDFLELLDQAVRGRSTLKIQYLTGPLIQRRPVLAHIVDIGPDIN